MKKESKKTKGLKLNLWSSKVEEIKKASEPLYKIPERTQDLIEIRKISKSGIFEVGNNKYSKTYRFTDINYESEPDEEQIVKLNQFCRLLDSVGTEYKISLLNRKRDMSKFSKEIFYLYKEDEFDQLRDLFNTEIERGLLEGKQEIEQIMYITVSTNRKDFEEAKAFFISLEASMSKKFTELGSQLISLNGNERLNLISSLYHLGDEFALPINMKDYLKNYNDFTNDIASSNFKYENTDTLTMNGKYGQLLYISKYANSVGDRFLKSICDLPMYSMVSIDYIPVPKDVGIKYIENKLIGIENNISSQQKKRNKVNDFSSDISYKTRREKEEVEDILDDINENDQNVYFVGVTICVFADNKEELSRRVETIRNVVSEESCKADIYIFKMREAFNTVLPLGVRQVSNTRFMLTRAAASLFPFRVQELIDTRPGKLWYGKNRISQNLIFANRKRLTNGNGFVLGPPGVGKSVSLKMEMLSAFLNTDDDIIIIDPTLEYRDIVDLLGGEYINFTNSSTTHINPLKVSLDRLDYSDMYGEIASMSEFLIGLCEKALNLQSIDPITTAIIDEAVRNLFFRQIKEKMEEVTLGEFIEEVKKNSRPEAERLYYAMRSFVTGNLNIFSHNQNVDINNRVSCFGIRDLGDVLRPMAMLITMVGIKRKVMENFQKGRATWIYVDEFHEMLGSTYTEEFFFKLIKEIRKLGGLVTSATQNISDTLQSYKARTMIDNSEYILLLKQSTGAITEILETISGMKETYAEYLTTAQPGQGMMKFGSTIFPVSLQIDTSGSLYNLLNTNMHEKSGAI